MRGSIPPKCIIVSLQQTPPEDVFPMIVFRTSSLLVKIYMASGLSLIRNKELEKLADRLFVSTHFELMTLMAS